MGEVLTWGLGIPQGAGGVIVAVQSLVHVEEGTTCKFIQSPCQEPSAVYNIRWLGGASGFTLAVTDKGT